MSRLGERATLAAYRLGWSVVRRLPARSAYRAFAVLADIVYTRNTRDVRRLRANYALVRPSAGPEELEGLVRAGMRAYLRYWCEAFRLPDVSMADLVATVRAEGDGPVRAELEAGRGVVLFLGHMGNWDTAGAWSTTQLAPVTTVAERLKPEELYAEFLAFRASLGMTILPLTGGDEVFPQLVAAIRRGALVPLLADRDLTARGLTVQLAGRPARVAAGPAALAVTTGAALFPVTMREEPHPASASGFRLVITFHDPVTDPRTGRTAERVAAMTQACVDALGSAIVEHPQDWHMMQRVFVESLDPGHRSAVVPGEDPAYRAVGAQGDDPTYRAVGAQGDDPAYRTRATG